MHNYATPNWNKYLFLIFYWKQPVKIQTAVTCTWHNYNHEIKSSIVHCTLKDVLLLRAIKGQLNLDKDKMYPSILYLVDTV